MTLRYLEIVTEAVQSTQSVYEAMHSVQFGAPVAGLGNAIVAKLENGSEVGIRPPMRSDEGPVIRPYFGSHNIDEDTKRAEAAGAKVALPPMPVEGGIVSIVICGGVETGLWQDA